MAKLPSVRLGDYLLVGEGDRRVLSREREDYILKLGARGLHIAYRQTEAVDERELFLYRLGAVNILGIRRVVSVAEALLYEMATV